MNNSVKIVLSSGLIIGVLSLFWFIIPLSAVWTCSYLFTVFSIIIAAASFMFYTHKKTGVPAGHAFPTAAFQYAAVSFGVSFFAMLLNLAGIVFSLIAYITVHTAILAYFIIRALALLAGAEYIHKLDVRSEKKHEAFQKEKDTYWRK